MYYCYEDPKQKTGDKCLLVPYGEMADFGINPSGRSMANLIKTRRNYSTVLTMGLPHAIGVTSAALAKAYRRSCRKRNLSNGRSDAADDEEDTYSYEHFTNSDNARGAMTASSSTVHSISIDIPFLFPPVPEYETVMAVSYSYKDNTVSIRLPSESYRIQACGGDNVDADAAAAESSNNVLTTRKQRRATKRSICAPKINTKRRAKEEEDKEEDGAANDAAVKVARSAGRREEQGEEACDNISASLQQPQSLPRDASAAATSNVAMHHHSRKIEKTWRKFSAAITRCNCFKSDSSTSKADCDAEGDGGNCRTGGEYF